jgi:Na+-driven multidrug efflux pump
MKFGLICDAINLWGFIIPVGYLLAFVFGAPVLVVYCFLNLDEIVKIPAEIIHYKKYGWVRNITLKNAVPPMEEESEGAGG